MAKLFLVAGPPGAGKTTVSDRLARSAARPTVHIPTDDLYTWIKQGFVLPFLPAAEAQNSVVTRAMIDASLAYVRGNYDVILDGILGPWLLPAFIEATRSASIPLAYVVLRPSLEVALTRAQEREGRALKDTRAIIGLYGAFRQLGPLEAHAIDTSAHAIEDTVAALAGFRRGDFALEAS